MWNPASRKDLLDAHGLLTAGLVDDAGKFRSGSVGIFQGKKLIHMAPPEDRVNFLMDDLLSWLKRHLSIRLSQAAFSIMNSNLSIL